MKSRSSSPQTSPQILRRFRVEGGAATPSTAASTPNQRQPSFRIEELPQLTMNGFQPFSNSPPSSSAISSASGLLSPVKNALQRANGDTTPVRNDALQASGPSSSPFAVSPGSENSQTPWSSAIGHATTSGKSGRVIERLMTENDKLKRDFNAQVIKCQELEKSMQTFKPQIEALRQENDNLSHARSVDSSLISRRDRKIEELKAELVSERSRRENAETLARQRQREKDDMEDQSRRDLQSLTESTRHATLHAEILETSHKQLGAEYRARAEAWRKDLSRLSGGREQDRQRLARLEVVADQMRQELERSKKLNGDLMEVWGKFEEDSNSRMQGMERETQAANDKKKELSMEMSRVVDEMRWLMGVKKNVKDADSANVGS